MHLRVKRLSKPRTSRIAKTVFGTRPGVHNRLKTEPWCDLFQRKERLDVCHQVTDTRLAADDLWTGWVGFDLLAQAVDVGA